MLVYQYTMKGNIQVLLQKFYLIKDVYFIDVMVLYHF